MMIFNKQGSVIRTFKFYFQGQEIELKAWSKNSISETSTSMFCANDIFLYYYFNAYSLTDIPSSYKK